MTFTYRLIKKNGEWIMDGVKPSIIQYSQPDWHVDAGQPAVEKEYKKHGVTLIVSETPYLNGTLSFNGESVDLDNLNNQDIEVLTKYFDVLIKFECTIFKDGVFKSDFNFEWSSRTNTCPYELHSLYIERILRVLDDLEHEIEINIEIILEHKE